MKFDIVTIFPAMIEQPLAAGILGRAIDRGTLDVKVRDLRDYTTDRHRVVDDVRVVESQHKGATLVELYVGAGELGRVIGKQGRTAAALRTLAAAAGDKEGKAVTLEIRDAPYRPNK